MNVETENSAMYSRRRQKLLAQIGEGIALIGSSGVSPDPLLFDKNLLYLTGQTSRKAQLLLAPGGVTVDQWETQQGPEVGRGRQVNEILFVEELSEREKFIDGESSSFADITRESGVTKVYGLSKLNEILANALMNEEVLWANIGSRPNLDQPLTGEMVRLNAIRERFLWVQFKNIAPLIHEMRRVKEPYEVECLRRAFEIHAEIYEKIMRALKPGENESLGEAIWHYETKTRGEDVTGETLDLGASHIIVATGANTAIGHYMDNDQEIIDGDLVLIDTGVGYKGYSSDITRTFPANGRFTPRQRELYAIVLEAQKRAIATMKPGSSALDAHKAVYKVWKKHGLERHGYGTCGHPVGLNIHDANGLRFRDQDQPFEPGVVLVIEPFLVIQEEGIGIRTEDGVLITEDGYEVLPGPPKEIEEVEELCRRD